MTFCTVPVVEVLAVSEATATRPNGGTGTSTEKAHYRTTGNQAAEIEATRHCTAL